MHRLSRVAVAAAACAVIAATTAHAAPANRSKALTQFQRDLVSVLALRADARPLLGAALLARTLPNQPKMLDYHHLIERAAATTQAGPAVTWAQLADCDAKGGACPNADAMAKLQQQAPDNAAVWLVKLGADARDHKQDDAREDLRRAAAAKLYDDYAGISLQALADSVGVLPPPAAALDPNHAAGAVGMQTVLIFGLASAQPQPSLQLVAKLCENAGEDASIKADCLNLAKLLQWGSSPLARSLGLHLAEVLADDPAAAQAAKDARRRL
ncbi:MAG TPA: hypothetical protein VFJ04_00160, partial [Rhodanobacteraceae bacterium]|nr:hypothetical protein [Rhodanobacteraceae bacterium]